MSRKCFLVGPTASGKTAVALEIARLRLRATPGQARTELTATPGQARFTGAKLLSEARSRPVEVISLDSMGVYRGMNVGTAKPTAAERVRVPHHLIDVAEPVESFSVGRYVSLAQAAWAQIESRGKTPLFVGGTPLYLKALVSGLFDGPAADPEFRAELEARASRTGAPALHEDLGRVDPASAARIHPNDLKRIVRALEVFHLTGRRLSEQQTQWSEDAGGADARIAGLAWDRAELYRRIEARVERMFAEGLVDEVRGLVEKYGRLGREASQALGYKEVLAHLAGGPGLAETIALVKRNTRRMAKRQLTWFRSFERIRWFAMTENTSAAETSAEIVRYFDEA